MKTLLGHIHAFFFIFNILIL